MPVISVATSRRWAASAPGNHCQAGTHQKAASKAACQVARCSARRETLERGVRPWRHQPTAATRETATSRPHQSHNVMAQPLSEGPQHQRRAADVGGHREWREPDHRAQQRGADAPALGAAPAVQVRDVAQRAGRRAVAGVHGRAKPPLLVVCTPIGINRGNLRPAAGAAQCPLSRSAWPACPASTGRKKETTRRSGSCSTGRARLRRRRSGPSRRIPRSGRSSGTCRRWRCPG
jgi:hypothetical protein